MTKINEKEAGVGPFFKKVYQLYPTKQDFCSKEEPITNPGLSADDAGGRGPEDGVRLHQEDDGRRGVEEVGANSGCGAKMSVLSNGDELWENHGEVAAEDGQSQVHADDVEHLPQVTGSDGEKQLLNSANGVS